MASRRWIYGSNPALMFRVIPLTIMSTPLNRDVDADFFLQLWPRPL